ncbi:MAG: hypothetical protein AMXMBFR8_00570 [Nevskiales bacterium]
MHALRLLFLMLAMSMTTAALAETFDGSVPLECTATGGHDCLPGKEQCEQLRPEGDQKPVLGIDVANKTIRSPYRTALLPIQHTTTNRESLVLQGTDLQFAWSALINRTTGAMTIAIGDRKGAYVVFAQCRAAPATDARPGAGKPPGATR